MHESLNSYSRSVSFVDCLVQDLRYSMRTMRREPGFSLFALMVVALGIGVSATVFSVLNTVLVRPLPFEQPEQLVWLANAPPEEGMSAATLQVNPFLAYKERNHSFSDVAAYFAFYGVGDSRLIVNGEAERLNALPVSQNFFALLGVHPVLGRLFTPEECKWNGPRAALLSHGLWERRFASDPQIVGRPIKIDDEPVTVIGVLPESFDFGSVFAPGTHVDLYQAFPLTPETDRWGNTLAVVGRLKPGALLGAAQAEATILSKAITEEQPNRNRLRLRLSLLREHVSGRMRPALMVLAFAVGVVMLIVCANLSNLLLARGAARQKELAIRSALGAGMGRIVRQILTESMLLAGCGAVLGTALAWAGTRAIAGLTSFKIPLLTEVHVDARVLLFTLLLAVTAGLVFGLLPALQVPRIALADRLKEQGRGSTGSRKHAWVRSTLVVSEIAFACVLLVGTGLLVRSFLRVLNVDLGFKPERAAAMRIDPSTRFESIDKAVTYFDEVLRRVRETRGVEAAGVSDSLPLGRNRSWGAAAKGVVYKRGEYPTAYVHIVSDGYLQAMGIPLQAGRDFSERDAMASERVIIINETLARRLFPGENPIGRLMRAGDRTDKRVVGVVSDVRHLALEQASGSEMYLPIRQTGDYPSVDVVVRSRLDDANLRDRVRTALLPLDPNLRGEQVRTLQQIVDQSVSPRRFIVLLLSGFACFALILASLGIYAVISYSVGQRTQEIGIRMALGAAPWELLKDVLLQTLGLTACGLLAGAFASVLVTQAMQNLLFGVTPGDPFTYVGMVVVLTAVASSAGYLPARRASRIDPTIALRLE